MAYLRLTDPTPKQLRKLPVVLGSAGWLGFAPVLRGTVGTLPGLVLALVLWLAVPWANWTWLPIAAFLMGASWYVGDQVLKSLPGLKDPGWFVLDELAAYFLTVGLIRPDSLLDIFAAFLTFRIYDISKPWPIRSFERIPGSVGILVDDLAAAVLAAWTWHALLLLVAALS